jgi:nicotinic acid mononucleotide adenylyltransferase
MNKLKWKIDRDPYYSKLYNKYGIETIMDAGFFFDSTNENVKLEDTLDIDCTPVHFIKDKVKVANKPCVILSTGSFSPIHSGHVGMMELAKEKLEESGWDVVGGYFAPDHDEYIHLKLGEKAIPFHYRMKYVLQAITHLDWATVDPWAGVFHTSSINFTDIIHRLDLYLEKHLGERIPVFFVCGGDNARFIKTFELDGYCVVVGRLGYDHAVEPALDYVDNKRLYYVEGNSGMSSTDVRKVTDWKLDYKDLILRHDDMPDSRDLKVVKLLEERFLSIRHVYPTEQRDNYALLNQDNIISLDSLTRSKYNFEVSRKYDFFGIKQLGYASRSSDTSLETQRSSLPQKKFFLFDDDIYSGGTIQYVTDFLAVSGIETVGTMSYFKSKSNEEIVDLRDFLYDTENGGLVVVQCDGKTRRVPYVYPFVCPFVRASVNDPKRFSKYIWEVNMEYFLEVGDLVKYEECRHYRDIVDKYIYRPKNSK